MSLDAACDHSSLSCATSIHADEVGYRRPPAQLRATAAGKKKDEEVGLDVSFPAPLVLPGDDLSYDPAAPAQSLLSWIRLKERNGVTGRRNVLYIAGPPGISADVPFVHRWAVPKSDGRTGITDLPRPGIEVIKDYLVAFYHGTQVKILPADNLLFTEWDQNKPKARSGFIGLNTSSESIGVRVRASPDGIFQRQLNLDDLLETAISILPDDAYALLMLVEQDLFEDEDDDFCCGRAYGGSRVAVVSMARYNPILDERQKVERQHAWPASHCESYIRACCVQQPAKMTKEAVENPIVQDCGADNAPLQAAVTAFNATLSKNTPTQSQTLSNQWLSRVCQTASHELGHCFGIAHCVYYACVMQSTSSLAEDVRQPPYLCPVDLAKVLRATGADKRERYAALRAFCEGRDVPMFAAFGAWLDVRIADLETQ